MLSKQYKNKFNIENNINYKFNNTFFNNNKQ